MSPAAKAFAKLDTIYDVLESVNIRQELLDLKYPKTEADAIQDGINNLLSDLEDILPGLEMESHSS